MVDLFENNNICFNDGAYTNIQKNNKDLRNTINNAFDSCNSHLDGNFSEEFPKKDKFFQRLWELWVCYQIVKSPFKGNLIRTANIQRKDKDSLPDLIIESSLDDKSILLECVCPHYNPKHLFEDKEFKTTKSPESTVITSSGYDKFIVSRYMSALRDKAKKVDNYKKRHPNSCCVLCVSGAMLSIFKTQKANEKLIQFYTREDFEIALKGNAEEWFNTNTHTIKTEYCAVNIEKKSDTKISTQDNEYVTLLTKFDGFVFSDYRPFITFTKNWHHIYCADQSLLSVLNSIFKN